MNPVKVLVQVILLTVTAEVGSLLSQLIHNVIPGSIIGMVLLFGLLKCGVVKLTWYEGGANWLLSSMLLFFVPSAVGIVQYGPLFVHEGLQLVLVIAVSTLLVMGSTGIVADRLMQKSRLEEEHHA